jgi:hypothetical protein
MLTIERSPQKKLFVRATCENCTLEILNPAAARLAVRGYGSYTKVKLLHSDCVRFFQGRQKRGWSYVPATQLFEQLQ